MINGLSIGGGQQVAQVTPAGAAIKLHFAYNNNTSNKNNNNYSGLKTVEQKMNNNSMTSGVMKVIEKIRETSGACAATGGVQKSSSIMGLSPAEESFAGLETPRATSLIHESGGSTEFPVSTEISPGSVKASDAKASMVGQGSGGFIDPATLRGLAPVIGVGTLRAARQGSGRFLEYQAVATGSATSISQICKNSTPASPSRGVSLGCGALRPFYKDVERIRTPIGAIVSIPNGMAAVNRVSQTGVSSLRWLPMPATKEKTSNGEEAYTKAASSRAEAHGSLEETAKRALASPQPQRTEDQENAFRRIEDVHNYAKLQDYSSDTEDEDEDEEEELDEEDEDDEEEARIQVQLPLQQEVTRIRREAAEEHADVDVVTVPLQKHEQDRHLVEQQPRPLQQDQPVDTIRPEHHARRPMNAFLIFCKRHRGIVKERYKTLENRAITKILGDWWAALDEQEKHCFTDLAQQNKDAFFNANPNFKWYKLPAPPLRTLATRPSNAAGGLFVPSEDQSLQQQQVPTPVQLQWADRGDMPRALLRRNYFKLADETQMGELSSLLQVQVQEKDYALQQVLSETSQFLSAHMPGANSNSNGNGHKRSLLDSNSSHSSEEEAVTNGSPCKKAKSVRSCKGKIYQELVNSGQLAAISKKSKARSPPAANLGGNFVDIPVDAVPNTPPVSPPEHQDSSPDSMQKHPRSASESSSSGFFDLEEKIKELPALSLDAYLQRKRSTKKKRKFSGSKKQRNSNSFSGGSMASNTGAAATASKGAVIAASENLVKIKQQQQQLQAVGSQRRKARKESITRRDVSAIEQEVASILPLTINGSYYFNQSGAPKAVSASATSSSTSPPLSSNSSSSSSSLSSQAAFDVTSSTSDLLILAEVAANRTELTKSN
ncbi:uncharacterized protein LOC108092779 [Drosophila ficusphila]|uniref:uncharacterized protein LOC108092779 n=1 Tax=Drosophila ficusphila TaxID=30025 RepID=UPI0007E67610|nr:uncharacterized protein LOC108092779 [Drosophila ficusphila]XP_017048014.1 uncharacterized protein LOC108092779 [Drosophila ficusphila]XP_017048015.1 uncharacterized protein LOC108092779 [Drosophila ficusphila]XP_017048016.1 uncharacterized protein LOC108092779 [Drosophila ficusphila]XP_017048017.1 uncharacterized protein LOC108092779 [Drosophila ficusphila]